MHQETILLLDGDDSARDHLLQRLQEAGYLVVESLAAAEKREQLPELVVASMPLTEEQQAQLETLAQVDRRPLFLFLLSEGRSQDATEALELGADDILRQPVSSHELRGRLRLLAERRRRDNLGRPSEGGEGQLSEVPVTELIKQFAAGEGTATIQIHSESHRGKLFFRKGQLCGAIVDHYQGHNALTRALRWQTGTFSITPRLDESGLQGTFDSKDPVADAERSAAQWGELIERLPPTGQSIQVDFPRVQQHLDELNDLAEQLLWQLASHRSLAGVIDDLDGDPVEALEQLCHLFERGYFSTHEGAPVSGVFTGTKAPSFDGVQTGQVVRSSRSDFSSGLASAAREAAAQLMAAAQPMAPPDQSTPDLFPSYEDMKSTGLRGASPSFDEAGFGPRSAPSKTTSDSRLDPVLFPLETPPPSPSGEMMLGPGLDINIHDDGDNDAALFALGDFKHLSEDENDASLPLEPRPIDTTVPSLVAPRMEDLDFEPPELFSLRSNDDSSLPSGEFEVESSSNEDPIVVTTAATTSVEEPAVDPEEGVRAMLQLETMDVLDKLLQTELSSIADQAGVGAPEPTPIVATAALVPAVSEAPKSKPPKASTKPRRSAAGGMTMAYGAGAEELETSAKKAAKSSPKEATPGGISLEDGMIGSKGSTALSLDDLPAQKGSFPSLSLSDEFFLKEEDLRPVKPNKFKTIFFYAIGGIAFMVIGFLGMGWLAQQAQTPAGKQPIARKPVKRALAGIAIPRRAVALPVAPRRVIPKPLLLSEPAQADGGVAPDGPGADAPAPRPLAKRPVIQRPIAAPRPVALRPVRRRPVRRRPVRRRPVRRRPVRVARVPRRRPVRRRPVRRRPAPRKSSAQASRLLRRALQYKRREKFSTAERLLRNALRLKPSNKAPYYSALGQVLYEREKTGSALSYLRKAYSISPRQTGPGLVTLGSIYYERKQRKRAKGIYRQYLRYFPRGKHADDVRAMLKN